MSDMKTWQQHLNTTCTPQEHLLLYLSLTTAAMWNIAATAATTLSPGGAWMRLESCRGEGEGTALPPDQAPCSAGLMFWMTCSCAAGVSVDARTAHTMNAFLPGCQGGSSPDLCKTC